MFTKSKGVIITGGAFTTAGGFRTYGRVRRRAEEEKSPHDKKCKYPSSTGVCPLLLILTNEVQPYYRYHVSIDLVLRMRDSRHVRVLYRKSSPPLHPNSNSGQLLE